MIAVSDTSPLSYLILLGRTDLLPTLFGRVLIPPAVRDELGDPRAPEPILAWGAAPPAWLEVCAIVNATDPALDRLQRGEREAILLAEEVAADIVILDERPARRIAAERGRTVTGLLGVLAEASDRNLIDLANALAQLQKTSFRAAPALLKSLLDRKR